MEGSGEREDQGGSGRFRQAVGGLTLQTSNSDSVG